MQASPLDFVAHTSMDLIESLSSVSSPEERDAMVINHIKKLWPVVEPVEDFKKDLEWVNVSEPISLYQHCTDKIVVLDFWTYCCINCYHVLPDLARLEKLHTVENGLVVIGVHCAKFNNERNSENILSAVQRYNIHHPVVNDADSSMWEALGICCWPTLLVLGPNNKPLFVLTGEGYGNDLVSFVGTSIRHFDSKLSHASLPMSISNLINPNKNILCFPTKVALNPFYRGREDEPFLAISDTGNHRVILTTCSGLAIRIIGGKGPGFVDDKLGEAKFNSPHGVTWLSSNVLAVCDTNNHAVRAVHLDEGTVELLVGTGQQSTHGDLGGKCLSLQSLSSPWDVVLYSTPDMDMSIRSQLQFPSLPFNASSSESNSIPNEDTKEKEYVDKKRVLLIACAGSHQIWSLFLDNTIWWKYKSYSEGTCVCIAGSGAEAARNSTYPNTAAFAQPSGLSLRNSTNPEIFIADSESSSIRRLALLTGHVSTLCGGDKNPVNLFAYGDVDDIGIEAKFQHPLGTAYCEANKTLYVADTYNHKIKKVDIGTQKVTTLNPIIMETTESAKFNEPSGLSVSLDGKYLYIADTNNHSIKLLNISKNVCQEFKVRLPEPQFSDKEKLILYKNDLFVNRKCGNLVLSFAVILETGNRKVSFTPGAPQNWSVSIRDKDNKDVTLDDFEFIESLPKGFSLPGRIEIKLKHRTDKTHYLLYVNIVTALCEGSVCFLHVFTIKSTILVRDSVKMLESYKITCKINPVRTNKSEQKKT